MAKGLGRGLNSLMGDDDDVLASGPAGPYQNLALDRIRASEDQPRKAFDQDSLQELAESIKARGILQPILVTSNPDGFYRIIAGERRFRAAALAGLREVPVLVKDMSEGDRLEVALIENIQRQDLSPLEEAQAYRHLMESFSLSQEDVAKKVGKQRSTVANSLRLLKLPTDAQQALEKGELSAGHARSLLSVVNPADQQLLLQRILAQGLSVRESESLAGDLNKGLRPAPGSGGGGMKMPPKRMPELGTIEERFIEVLGTRVNIKGNGKKGKLEIAYYSSEDLERLFDIMSPGSKLF